MNLLMSQTDPFPPSDFDSWAKTYDQAIHSQSLFPFDGYERVLETMAHSQQLRSLRRHKLRPLDKPLIPYSSAALASRAAYDAMIDAQNLDAQDDYLLN